MSHPSTEADRHRSHTGTKATQAPKPTGTEANRHRSPQAPKPRKPEITRSHMSLPGTEATQGGMISKMTPVRLNK